MKGHHNLINLIAFGSVLAEGRLNTKDQRNQTDRSRLSGSNARLSSRPRERLGESCINCDTDRRLVIVMTVTIILSVFLFDFCKVVRVSTPIPIHYVTFT